VFERVDNRLARAALPKAHPKNDQKKRDHRHQADSGDRDKKPAPFQRELPAEQKHLKHHNARL
jgi:hypothetical protein